MCMCMGYVELISVWFGKQVKEVLHFNPLYCESIKDMFCCIALHFHCGKKIMLHGNCNYLAISTYVA